ncbi:MAG: hypothetical protein FJ272_20380, partial [Planctomycetes bacterium]|nr:hypothetical protein [Planctomycetota bacterium]
MCRSTSKLEVRNMRATAWVAVAMSAFLAGGALYGQPVAFWHSDPIQPGEAALVVGGGLTGAPRIEVVRLPDAAPGSPSATPLAWPRKSERVETLQPTDGSVKFVLPATLKPGVFAYRISTSAGATVGLLNRPCVWWAQREAGDSLRLFGKDLNLDTAKCTLLLRGPKSLTLSAEADSFAAKAALPADLPAGEYQVFVHNGCGGPAAWSEPVAVAVSARPQWPQTVLNVKDFGADGTGARDDTASIQAALAKAQENGGGIIYFPRGRYQVTDMLTIPRFTVLRGEKRELSCLFWPDMAKPPEALIKGANAFGLEDLTLYASNHRHVIMGDLGKQPDAGNVFLRRIRVRADAYRGHLKPEDVDERFRTSLRWSTGGGDTVRLGGENVEVTDCDLYGSGRSLYLSRARNARVSGNTLHNGRWGWYCLEGSDGLIFERNTLIGGDLMSTGGGIANYGTACSRNIYYAHNRLRLMHGWDREAMTTDAGGEAYFGKVSSVAGAVMTLATAPKWGGRDWKGGGVFILDGKGAGQYRHV